MWTAIAAIAGSILAPLLGFIIARYWKGLQDKAQEELRQKQEEQDNQAANAILAAKDEDINTSIDAQAAARDKWRKDNAAQ